MYFYVVFFSLDYIIKRVCFKSRRPRVSFSAGAGEYSVFVNVPWHLKDNRNFSRELLFKSVIIYCMLLLHRLYFRINLYLSETTRITCLLIGKRKLFMMFMKCTFIFGQCVAQLHAAGSWLVECRISLKLPVL